jgi:hypothetical protein
MWTGHEHKRPLEPGLEHINPIKAQLLKILAQPTGGATPLSAHNTTPLSGRRSRLSASTSAGRARMHGATATRNSGTHASEAVARSRSLMTTPRRTLDLAARRCAVVGDQAAGEREFRLRAREIGDDAVDKSRPLDWFGSACVPRRARRREGDARRSRGGRPVGEDAASPCRLTGPAARRPRRRTGGRRRALADPASWASR